MAFPTLTDALVIGQARKLLGEPTARRFTDVQLTRYLQDGLSEIMLKTLGYQATATFALVTTTHEYNAAAASLTSCIGIRAVIYMNAASATAPGTSARALLRMHPRHFKNIRPETAGMPLEYFWSGEYFYVWPDVLGAYDGHYIKIFYYSSEVDIDAADITKFPLMYGPYLSWYIFSRALSRLGKHAQAQQYLSYFNNIINYHAQDIQADYNNVDSEDMMNLPDYVEFA